MGGAGHAMEAETLENRSRECYQRRQHGTQGMAYMGAEVVPRGGKDALA